MAITPIKPITSASATATNGSAVITVTGSVDCSFVYSGTVVLLGARKPVEAVSGTIQDGSGNSTITLRSAWDQPTTTDTLFAFNSIEGLGEAIRRARETVQNISAIEALTTNGLIERTGAGTYASVPVSTFAKTILDDTSAAAVRTTIAAQQLDATLTAIAGLATAANKLPYFTGTDAAALADLTVFGRTLIAAADSDAVKTILGLNVTTADIQATVFSDFRRNIHQLYEPFGLTTKAITDIWATTRAGAATYTSPTGLKTAATNTPRIEYSPTTGEARGLLCEAQRTRLNTISAVVTAPESFTVTAAAHTMTFYGTGTVTLSGAATGSLVGTGADTRVTLTFTPAAGTLTYTPSGTVTGLQFEASAAATSLIQGEGAAQTRPTSQYVRTITDLVNKSGSTFIIDFFVDDGSTAATAGIFGIGDGTTANSFNLSRNTSTNAIRAFWYSGGASPSIASAGGSAPINVMQRALLSFKDDGTFSFALNGIDYGSSLATSPNTTAWVSYWFGGFRTPLDVPVVRAAIAQFRVIPRYISSATERAELSRQ